MLVGVSANLVVDRKKWCFDRPESLVFTKHWHGMAGETRWREVTWLKSSIEDGSFLMRPENRQIRESLTTVMD